MTLNHCNEVVSNIFFCSMLSYLVDFPVRSSTPINPMLRLKHISNYNYIGTWYHYPSKEFWKPVQTHVTSGPSMIQDNDEENPSLITQAKTPFSAMPLYLSVECFRQFNPMLLHSKYFLGCLRQRRRLQIRSLFLQHSS